MRLDYEDIELIGEVSVDSGMIWIGDPCYVDSDDAAPFDDWKHFCRVMGDRSKHEFREGMCVGTAHGDGTYPVYSIKDKSRNRAIIIDFDGVIEEDED